MSHPPQPNPYDPAAGQPGPYGYGAGQPGMPTPPYASWGKRVGATLIDGLLGLVTMIPYFVGIVMLAGSTSTDPVTGEVTTTGATGTPLLLMGLSGVLYLGYYVWNICLKQGRTGYSIGKGVLGIRLLKEETGAPIGAGMAFVRQILHVVDGLPCYLGYLWPLWDAKRQTFADKILTTVVIEQPKS